MNDKPIAAGKSSFNLIDTQRFFSELNLQAGITFLDVACGRGAYSLAASDYVGPAGHIIAVDLWKEGIEDLRREVMAGKNHNIEARVADVSLKIPIEDRSVDVCLLATVFHDLIQDHTDQGTLKEIKRVMKPQGTVAVVEFKKMQGPPGPPLEIRISVEEVTDRLRPYSFNLIKTVDVGSYNYLAVFTVSDVA
ncbi:MAG: class I SAM-dependent methyltransferase [Thermodesulfobacteriota bacterium]